MQLLILASASVNMSADNFNSRETRTSPLPTLDNTVCWGLSETYFAFTEAGPEHTKQFFGMKTRAIEQYKVQHPNTERFDQV